MLLTSDRQRDAIPLGVCEFGKTRCGVSTAGLSSPFGGTSRAPVKEGKAARRTPEQAEKPLPTYSSKKTGNMKKLLIVAIAALAVALLLFKNATPESMATGRTEKARIVHELTEMAK